MSVQGDETITDAQAREQLESGFSGTQPTETQAQTIESTEANPPAEPEVVEPPVEYVQLTRQELDDLKARVAAIDGLRATQEKSFGTAFGKLGDIEKRVKQFSEGAAEIDIPQSEIDALREDGFEPMAKALEKLRSLRALPAAGIDPAQVEALFQQRMAPAIQKQELRHLATVHPDWQAVDSDPAFAKWVVAQGQTFAQDLAKASNEYDADAISSAMTTFKSQRKAQQTASAKAALSADARRGRISAAVTPKGSGGTNAATSTAIDEFNAGYNKYRTKETS